MKKLSLLLLVSAFAFCGCSDDDEVKNEVVVSFENQLTQSESEFKTGEGEKETPTDYYYKWNFKDPNNLVELTHYYSEMGFGGGFTYTNKTDVTTPGYTNNSAITAKGKSGKVYLTSNSSSFTPARITNLNSDKYGFKGAWITNTTYAYLAIKDRNDGNNPPYVKQFGSGDWFKVTAIGYQANGSEIGKVDFYLADYRDGKTKVVNTWEWFDWSSIEDADYIQITLSSTDNNDYGMATPSYFCLDGITLIEN
ncbi:DUF4465 domain-containing protein [Bacteroides ovatus]|jgi:hypothetical protein|uniref:DUF4465 domain-containing protein n=1 Tax=Bacteroides ovatus TaxID=28116 RepID=UPI0018987D58|nr:DUF4465 domain-containing protein [Bacteroides ovatus]MDC2624121.1 DUF4465 domain-containing protein [Bacteroides ovatus]MDC2638101.1 DUF4465 domain-containing protein [Bacteroides ovatus]MDC2652055.1 DUF4465 domain-containing protein [Bacteroides ovatus]